MLNLPDVTLVAVSNIKKSETQHALDVSQQGITFRDVLFLQPPHIKTSDEYSHFMLYELDYHIRTPFALVIQYDGYIINPDMWSDEFLRYDYIGAPWPPRLHHTPEGQEIRVGNGGFSLRSKELLAAPRRLKLPFTDNGTGFFHEDGNLCNYHRKALEDYGISFAPVEVAARFSSELTVPETTRSFGFHKYKPC